MDAAEQLDVGSACSHAGEHFLSQDRGWMGHLLCGPSELQHQSPGSAAQLPVLVTYPHEHPWIPARMIQN